MTTILGILNLTRDSFSDGGRYRDVGAALAHARRMRTAGAAFIDVGAESSHPDSEDVSAAEEIRRLAPVVGALCREGVAVSVDTCKPTVMRAMLELGASMINDITALRDPDAVAAVRGADARIIVMHARRAAGASRAERRAAPSADVVEEILSFFAERVAALEAAGVARGRLILDPGMGYFLGSDASASLAALRGLSRLRALGLPLCVCTSRKSFVGATLADPPRPVDQRGAGTLATELWAAAQGVEFMRTHDVQALADALRVWAAIENSE